MADLLLSYSAISDVGRVRKDNQDSGYAGPWLLTVCDGVGGAARGDIASSTAVSELRQLDVPPPDGADRWIKTIPEKGWFVYFRIYGPEDAAFDGTWQLPDFEIV